jgi:dTDP-4-amino-4,6-dideoxygalactose transaminase
LTIKMLDVERQRAALEPGLSEAVMAVLDHGQFIGGPEVKELEDALGAYAGVAHTVGCANGTDALQILLRAMGVGPGDQVFVPSLTYYATAEAAAFAGAEPVFVDVDLATACMDADSLAAAVEAVKAEGGRPKAVIAVDLFSLPADYAAIGAVCAEHGMKLLIDAAQSFGTVTGNGRACAQGDAAATSFYPSKSLGGYGDGGAMFSNDPDIAADARAIARHGLTNGAHTHIGTNSRLDSIQAAILLKKLSVFDDELAARRQTARIFSEAFAPHLTVPAPPEGSDPCWAYYVSAPRSATRCRPISRPAASPRCPTTRRRSTDSPPSRARASRPAACPIPRSSPTRCSACPRTPT